MRRGLVFRICGDNNVKSPHITHKTWLFRQKRYTKQGFFVKRDPTFIQVNQSYPLHPICIHIYICVEGSFADVW